MATHYYFSLGRRRDLVGEFEDNDNGMWELTIKLPVFLRFGYQEASDPKWTPDEILAWKGDFFRGVKTTWSRRWLIEAVRVPSRGVLQRLGLASVTLPVVNVFVEVCEAPGRNPEQIVQATPRLAGRLFVVNVFHTRPDGRRADALAHVGSSHPVIQLNQDDIRERSMRGGRSRQRADVHEAGHMLGLRHPLCEGNQSACYGEPGTPQGDSIMGVGMRVTIRDYAAFAEIMEQIKPGYGWQVSAAWHAPRRAEYRPPTRPGALQYRYA